MPPPFITPLTQQDVLDLFAKLLPDEYLSSLKDPGPGYEVLQAYANLAARGSLAVSRLGKDAFILTATGGAFTTGRVAFAREAPNAVPIVMRAGTVVQASKSGRQYRTTTDAVFTPADLGHTANVVALYKGYEYDVPGQVTAADGEVLEGEIDTLVTPVEVTPADAPTNSGSNTLTFAAPSLGSQAVLGLPAAGQALIGKFISFTGAGPNDSGTFYVTGYDSATSTLQVRNPTGSAFGPAVVAWSVYEPAYDSVDRTFTVFQIQATGAPALGFTPGSDAALDQHGADRGIFRQPGEQDDPYRARIRALPDNISPDAVLRNLRLLLEPVDGIAVFIETWDIRLQTCWNAPGETHGGTDFDPNCFVWNDPRPPVPYRNRWLSENLARGSFIVVVTGLSPLSDFGMVWNHKNPDDTYVDPFIDESGLANLHGRRALCAWNVPSTLAGGYLQGCWNGYDQKLNTLYANLYATLQNVKAAGINAVLELEGQ